MCQGCTAGISDGFLPNNISLFPNPTNGPIHLTTNDQNEIINLKIINSNGQVILEKSKLVSKQIILDISTEAAGIYFLEVTMADGIYRSKFLKD
jgi:hypothetical protein